MKVSCIKAPRTLMGQPTVKMLLGGAAKVYVTLLNLRSGFQLYINIIALFTRCAAVDTFEAMLRSGSRPHAAVYSSIIDVLWQTGIPWAQAKALHLFNSAVQCGPCPIPKALCLACPADHVLTHEAAVYLSLSMFLCAKLLYFSSCQLVASREGMRNAINSGKRSFGVLV